MSPTQSPATSDHRAASNRFVLLALISIFSGVAGCVTPVTTTIHARGRVVDAATKNPVFGARVTIENHPGATALTDRDGAFDLPPQTERLFFIPVIADPGGYYRGSVVVVEAVGYTTAHSKQLDYNKRPIEITRK